VEVFSEILVLIGTLQSLVEDVMAWDFFGYAKVLDVNDLNTIPCKVGLRWRGMKFCIQIRIDLSPAIPTSGLQVDYTYNEIVKAYKVHKEKHGDTEDGGRKKTESTRSIGKPNLAIQ